ncbi:energy transducer TonB [Sphingobium abikonense]|uniref:energy transducer TonB n=1 Tax=Sphingobium abikonense TaxID=86193 RepID=UPI003513B8D3
MVRFFCIFAPLAIPVAASASEPAQRATPVGNPGTWVTSDDYPMEAMRQEIEGSTSFRLDINRDGIPTNCTTTSSSGSALLDDTACAKVMERARFNPAKDAGGRLVGDVYSTRVNWRLPDTDGVVSLPPLPMHVVTTFYIETNGSVSDCETLMNGKPAPVEGHCAQQILGRRYPIQEDAAGNPIRQKMRTSLRYEKIDADD